jgi:hypothetical protein
MNVISNGQIISFLIASLSLNVLVIGALFLGINHRLGDIITRLGRIEDREIDHIKDGHGGKAAASTST